MNVYVYLRSKLNWEVVQQNKMNVYTKRLYFLSPWVIFFLFDFLKNVCKQTDANQSPEELLAVYVSAKSQISLNIFLGSVLSFLSSHNAVLILVLGNKKKTLGYDWEKIMHSVFPTGIPCSVLKIWNAVVACQKNPAFSCFKVSKHDQELGS